MFQIVAITRTLRDASRHVRKYRHPEPNEPCMNQVAQPMTCRESTIFKAMEVLDIDEHIIHIGMMTVTYTNTGD